MDSLWVTFLTGVGIGLASSFHCIGMCGGIAGAFSFNIHPGAQQGRFAAWPFVAAFNVGRVVSYVAAGLLVGSISQLSVQSFHSPLAFSLLQQLAALILISIGLYVAGWFPQFVQIERVGTVIWSRLEPIGRRFVPIDNANKAFMFGAIWGWLPCGMVYSMLLMALTSGDVARGAVFMAAFGLGTLPAMFGVGLFAGFMKVLTRYQVFKKLIGVSLIAVAAFTLVKFQFFAGNDVHHDHSHQPATTQSETDPHQHHH